MNPFASLGVATPRVVSAPIPRLLLVALAACVLLPASLAATAVEPATAVDFQRDIRPILSDNCFACHGPDEATREADLRLDTRDGAFSPRPPAGRSTRPRDPAVVPGDASASLLVERITHADTLRRMPPEISQKTLSDEQIDLLKRWIEQGADWDQHWSFKPPPTGRRRPRSKTKPGSAIHSTASSWRVSRTRDSAPQMKPTGDRPGPARGPRPDRPASRPRHPGDVPRRHRGRRLRAARRPPARVTPLGRAPRPLLAGRGPLRRHPRCPQRQLPGDVRLPGLGHQGVQARTSRSTSSRSSRSPATCWKTRPSTS